MSEATLPIPEKGMYLVIFTAAHDRSGGIAIIDAYFDSRERAEAAVKGWTAVDVGQRRTADMMLVSTNSEE